MGLNSLSWLLIGMGLGLAVGEKELYIFISGIVLICTGFVIHLISEKERRKEWIKNEK